jgi:hypothetical protein
VLLTLLPARAARPQAGWRDRPEVMIMPGEARAPGRPPRRLARRLASPSKLRRPADRIEAAIVVLLSAAFLAAVAAAPYLGERIYQWQRADAALLHPAVAVLSPGGPAGSYLVSVPTGRRGGAWAKEAAARWRAPDGQRRSGTLTTVTAPGIWGASAWARVRVWLTGSGDPAAPPGSRAGVIFAAVVLATAAACGAGMVLIICYWACRRALDRRRMAGWESAWALTGPRWTTRR